MYRRLALRPLAAFLLFTTAFSSCARFRINELATRDILSLPMSDDATRAKPGQVIVHVKEGALYDLPSAPAVYANRILLPFPARNIVVEFGTNDSSPERLFAPENARPTPQFDKVKVVRLPAGQVGRAVPADDATLVQLFPNPEPKKVKPEPEEAENRLPAVLYPDSLSQPPSEIYLFTTPDAKPRKLEADTNGGTKFRGVRSIIPTEKGILFVVHTPEGSHPVACVYKDFRLLYVLSVPDSLFVAKDASVELEDIFPFPGQPEALASLVLRKRNSFEPEKRVLYVLRSGAEPREIFRTDEKEHLPVWTRDDGGFLLGRDEDGAGMILEIYSKDGEYLNNDRLRYEGLREGWHETFFNGENRLFSVRLERGRYAIVEWK